MLLWDLPSWQELPPALTPHVQSSRTLAASLVTTLLSLKLFGNQSRLHSLAALPSYHLSSLFRAFCKVRDSLPSSRPHHPHVGCTCTGLLLLIVCSWQLLHLQHLQGPDFPRAPSSPLWVASFWGPHCSSAPCPHGVPPPCWEWFNSQFPSCGQPPLTKERGHRGSWPMGRSPAAGHWWHWWDRTSARRRCWVSGPSVCLDAGRSRTLPAGHRVPTGCRKTADGFMMRHSEQRRPLRGHKPWFPTSLKPKPACD